MIVFIFSLILICILLSVSTEKEIEIKKDVISLDLRYVHILDTIFNTTKPILLFLYNDDDHTSISFKMKYEYYINLLVNFFPT